VGGACVVVTLMPLGAALACGSGTAGPISAVRRCAPPRGPGDTAVHSKKLHVSKRQLQHRPQARTRLPQIHVWPLGRVRGGRLPMALHVDEPTRFEIAATMRGRAKVHEHPLARLGRYR
jgi:hypothetical protein